MDKAIIFLTSSNRLEFVLIDSRNETASAQALDALRQNGSEPLFVTFALHLGCASHPFCSRKDLLKKVILERADEFWSTLVRADSALAFAD